MKKIQFLMDKSDVSVHRASSHSKDAITNTRGVDKIKSYTGDVSMWKEWRFKMETWLGSINPSFQTLVNKLDKSEMEPEEPEEGAKMNIGSEEITTDEEWCSEQLYQMLVQKTEVPALAIIRNLNTHGKARGLSAWYRTMRDAEGQVEVKKDEITEKVFYSGRKAVAARDVAPTIEAWEGELREYTTLTGKVMENSLKMINLERMLPESIRKMFQTVEIKEYTKAKEYALKQVRARNREKGP